MPTYGSQNYTYRIVHILHFRCLSRSIIRYSFPKLLSLSKRKVFYQYAWPSAQRHPHQSQGSTQDGRRASMISEIFLHACWSTASQKHSQHLAAPLAMGASFGDQLVSQDVATYRFLFYPVKGTFQSQSVKELLFFLTCLELCW